MGTELVGWASSIILLMTLGRQVYTQWQTGATSGVSRWLFVGQLATAVAGLNPGPARRAGRISGKAAPHRLRAQPKGARAAADDSRER